MISLRKPIDFFLKTLFIMSIAVVAAFAQRPMTIDDLYAMRRVGDAALSPDGAWVAYTVGVPDLKENKTLTQIYIVATKGGTARQLTTGTTSSRAPVWSPDGSLILFESSRSGTDQLWMINVGGGEAKQVTMISTGAAQAVWAPDGKSIAYISEVFPEFSAKPFPESDSLNRARLNELSGRKVKAQIFTHLLYRHWNVWNDGRRKHIFVQPLTGGSPHDLTPGNRDAVPNSSTFSAGIDYAFSPDGTEIAYTATPLPEHEEAWRTNHDVYTVPVAGGSPKQITTNPAADGYPRYSPDGKYIAYRAQSRPDFEGDRWQVMLYDRKTGAIRSLSDKIDLRAGSLLWSPDSKKIYFDAEENAQGPLFSVSLGGNDLKKIVDGKSFQMKGLSSDGKNMLLIASTAIRPSEVFLCSVADGKLTTVTHENDALFGTLSLPVPEAIWFEGAQGAKVHAWMVKPLNFDPQKKYPLVYMIHGGPQGAWENSWSYRWNPVLWATQGYVVVAPNPRGSTGFGQKFTDEISGDWGGKVFVDLMKGLDYVKSLQFIDSSRTAAAGASFGGYMMNWFAGNAANRFKTIITHDGVYNFESMYGTTDEVWFDEWEHGGTPWDIPQEYRKFSPHAYAKNFKTPMLVIHGELDYRVPLSEAMQLFTALQRQGVPSKFLYFPDEAHQVLKPANSKLWHETVFGWLEEYLH